MKNKETKFSSAIDESLHKNFVKKCKDEGRVQKRVLDKLLRMWTKGEIEA